MTNDVEEVMASAIDPQQRQTEGGSDAPRRRRWLRVMAGSVLAVLIVLPVAAVGLVYATHPRDEAAYINDLHTLTKGPAWIRIWQQGDAWVIAEGDRACEWLGSQPYAGLRHAGRFEDGYLRNHWVRSEQRTANPLWFAGNGHYGAPIGWLPQSAWNDLCPATWYLHKEHYPFGAPNYD